ncbi:MAG: hypothetical protein HZB54_01785 [Deltaproteobacteria bacterium]|nr:hypothetical protein [Deltaproteobacteria bacterium]
MNNSNKLTVDYLLKPVPIFILIAFTLSFLIIILMPESRGKGEAEQVRQIWFIAILFLSLSFNIKTFILYILKWGKIKECISSCFKAYSGSILLLVGFFAFIFVMESITATVKQEIDIREFLGGILWWQSAGFFIWIPSAIIVEGGILRYLRKDNPNRKPWRSAIFSNILDLLFKIILLLFS